MLPFEEAKALADFAQSDWKNAAFSLVSLSSTSKDLLRDYQGKELEGFVQDKETARVYEESARGQYPAGSLILDSYAWGVKSYRAR